MPPTRIGTAWLRPTAFTVDPAPAFGCATPYCQANFSRETFFVLIWVSGEYRRPCGSPAYDGHPADRDALCAKRTVPAMETTRTVTLKARIRNLARMR